MNKQIVLECYSEISIEPVAYGDRIVVLKDNKILAHYDASCWPNPYQPHTSKSYLECYGVLAPCQCHWKFVPNHPKYHKCILLNTGMTLPARYPNVNHEGRNLISQVFVHEGWSKTRRGASVLPRTYSAGRWWNVPLCGSIKRPPRQ